MHISEGVLSPAVLAGGAALTAVGTGIGLTRINYDKIINVAILTATFFVASLIHVPLGPGSVHLILNGMLGIILGWACFPAILIALLLQAVLFQFGGLVVLGVNTFNMAASALICYYTVRPLMKGDKGKPALAGFLAGFFSVFLASLFMAASLALSDRGFWQIAQLTVVAHLPVMVIEGFITMFTLRFLAKVKPEILL